MNIYVNAEQNVAFTCQMEGHSVFYGTGATRVYSQFQEAKQDCGAESPPNLRFLIQTVIIIVYKRTHLQVARNIWLKPPLLLPSSCVLC